jgi:hypothetical protein
MHERDGERKEKGRMISIRACVCEKKKENGYACACTQFQTQKRSYFQNRASKSKSDDTVALVSIRALKQDPTPLRFNNTSILFFM